VKDCDCFSRKVLVIRDKRTKPEDPFRVQVLKELARKYEESNHDGEILDYKTIRRRKTSLSGLEDPKIKYRQRRLYRDRETIESIDLDPSILRSQGKVGLRDVDQKRAIVREESNAYNKEFQDSGARVISSRVPSSIVPHGSPLSLAITCGRRVWKDDDVILTKFRGLNFWKSLNITKS
jgi:hypothetical protein